MAEPTTTLPNGANQRPMVEDAAARTKSYSASQSYEDFVSFEDSLVASSESDEGKNERYASLDSEISMLMSKDSAEGGVKSNSNRFGLPPKSKASVGKAGNSRTEVSAVVAPEGRDEIEEKMADRDSEPPAPTKIVRDTTEYRMYGELLHTMSSDVSARTTDLYDNYLAIVQPEESSSSSSDEDTIYSTLSSGSETEKNWFSDIQNDISKMFCFMEEDARERKVLQRAAREKMRSMDARQRQKKELRKKMARMTPDEARVFKKKLAQNKNLKSLLKEEDISKRSPKEKKSKSRPSSRNQRPSSSRKSRSQRPSSSKSNQSPGSKPSTPLMKASTSSPKKNDDNTKSKGEKSTQEVQPSTPAPKPSPTEAVPSTTAGKPISQGVQKSIPDTKPSLGTKKEEKVEEKVESKKESVVDKMLQEVENDAPKTSDKKQPKKKWKKLFR